MFSYCFLTAGFPHHSRGRGRDRRLVLVPSDSLNQKHCLSWFSCLHGVFDAWNGREGTPFPATGSEPLARATLYFTDENTSGDFRLVQRR